MRVRFVLAALFALLPAFGASAQDLVAAEVGADFSSEVTVGEKRIPLLPGVWKLIARTNERAPVPVLRASLVQERDGRVARAMLVETTTSGASIFWHRSTAFCDRKGILFAESDRNYDTKHQQCRQLNYIALPANANVGPRYSDVVAHAAKGKRLNTVLSLDFFLVEQWNLLAVQYWFNPDAEGVVVKAADQSGRNPWHPDEVAEDAARQAYVDKLKALGDEVYPRLLTAIRGR